MLAFAQLLTFVSLLLAFAECVFNAQQLNKYAACARTSSDVRALDPQPSARSWRDVETSELDFTVLNVYRDGAMPLLVALSLSNSSACEASRGAACQAELHIGTLVLSANNVEFLAISAINVDVVRPGVVEQPLSIVNIGDANGDSVDEFAVFSVQFLHSGAATRTCVRIGSVRVDNAGSSLTATLSPPVPVDRLFLESAQCANFTLDSESPGADAALVLTSPTRPPALQLVAPDLSRGAVNDALYVGFPAARAVYAYDVVGTADASLLSPCTVFRSPRLLRSEPEVPGFGARVFQMQMHTDVNGLLVIDQAGGRHAFRIDGNVTSSLPEPTAVEAANIVGSSGSSLRVLAVAQDSDGNGVDELFVGLTVSEVASAAAADGSFDGALLPPKRAFLSQWFTTPFVKNVTGVRWSGGAMGAQFFGKILDQSVIRTRANMNPYSKLTRAASVNATAPNRAVHIVSYRAANGRPLLGFVPASVMTSDDLTCLGNVESSLLSLAERSPLPARIGTAVARLDLFLPPSTVHLQWVDETTGLLVAFSDRASLAYLIVARRTEPHFALVDDMLAREPETYGVRLAAMVDGNVFFVDSTGHQIWFEEIDAHSEPNDSLPFLDIVRHNELVLTNVTAGHVIGLRHVPFQRTEHARLFPRDTRPFGIDNLTATDTELLASATLSGVTLRDDANVLALVVAEKNLSLFYHLSLTNPSDPNRQAPLIAAVERPLDAMWTGDRMYVIVTDSRGVSVFNATYGYVMHVAFGTGHAHIQFTWRRGQFEDIYFVEGGYIFRLEYAMGQFDPNGSPVFTLRRRLTIPQDEIVADMALCPSGLVSYVLTTSGSLHLLWRYSDTDHWMLMTSSPVLHAVAGASSLLLATGGDRMFVAVQGGLVVVADTCKETILAPPTTSMTSSELTSPSGTSTHAAVTAEHSERLSTGASLAILAAAFVCCCFVLLPLMLCAALRMSARARRRSSELLRSVLPSGMIGTAADNNDGDGDYQLDDMTQLTRPRTSVTGRSEASLTGVWTRHARTIDGNQSWTDKIGGRVVSDTTDDIILVSHDQPWTTVDEGTMLANRSARSSTLTSITDIANALESSALTSQQKAMVRRFGWTNNIATVMKGSQYRDLESLFLLEAKSFRETSSSQRPSRDGVGARQSVGGAGSPPTPPRRSRDGAMARLTAGGAVPLPPRPTPAADYQVAVVNELLARQPSQMRWNRQESRTPTLRMSKTHLDFGLAIDELAPTQRTLVDQIEFHNDGKRALLIATPIISSPSFTLTFAPGVLTVPPKSSGVVSVALTLTRPTSIYELVDLVVCDLATVFVTIVLDAKLQSDIDPKALRFRRAEVALRALAHLRGAVRRLQVRRESDARRRRVSHRGRHCCARCPSTARCSSSSARARSAPPASSRIAA
jgi:hypothetical protein